MFVSAIGYSITTVRKYKIWTQENVTSLIIQIDSAILSPDVKSYMRGTWKIALSTPVPSPSSSSRPPKASPTRLGTESTTDPETSASRCPGPEGGEERKWFQGNYLSIYTIFFELMKPLPHMHARLTDMLKHFTKEAPNHWEWRCLSLITLIDNITSGEAQINAEDSRSLHPEVQCVAAADS